MNAKVPAITIVASLMVGINGMALAEEYEQEPMADDAEMLTNGQEEEGVLLRATEVTDYELRNEAGERIGDISDLAVDTHHGKLAYVVVRLDEPVERGDDEALHEEALGAIGVGREHYAVPWEGFRAVAGEEALTLTIDRNQLARLELFDDQWDTLNNTEQATEHHETLGFTAYWEDGDETMLQVESLSDLRGRDVQGIDDDAIAQIEDLKVDSREGHLAYAVLNYGGFLGIGRDYVAVPYQALQRTTEDDELVFALDVDQEALDAIAFDRGDWPNMTDEQWAQQVHETFDREPYWQVFGYTPPRDGEQTDE